MEMEQDNIYERYGLGGNPFLRDDIDRAEYISDSHVDISIDDTLAQVKQQVVTKKQYAVVLLAGEEGMGKTERIIVAQKEAVKNSLFCRMVLLDETTRCAMKSLVTTLSPKGSALLSNDKWERELAKVSKKIEKGYDPLIVGGLIADALNKKRPSFLLIDNLHLISYAKDGTSFIKALTAAFQNLEPGVFILITGKPSHLKKMMSYHRAFGTSVTHRLMLSSLSVADAFRIVKKRLQIVRFVTNLDDPIYPFTKSAISYMNDISDGVSARLLDASSVALVAAGYNKAIMINDEFCFDMFNRAKKQAWFQMMNFHLDHAEVGRSEVIVGREMALSETNDLSTDLDDADIKGKIKDELNVVGPGIVPVKPNKTRSKKDNGDEKHTHDAVQPSYSGDNGGKKRLIDRLKVPSKDKHIDFSVEEEMSIVDESNPSSPTPMINISSTVKSGALLKKGEKRKHLPVPKVTTEKVEDLKSDIEFLAEKTNESLDSSHKDAKKKVTPVSLRCPECQGVFTTNEKKDSSSTICPFCGFKESSLPINRDKHKKKKSLKKNVELNPDSHNSNIESSNEESLKKNNAKVSVRCPECNGVFDTPISKNLDSLICPFCGFQEETSLLHPKTSVKNTGIDDEDYEEGEDIDDEIINQQEIEDGAGLQCPECNRIFSMVLDKRYTTVSCPYCGFKGSAIKVSKDSFMFFKGLRR